MHIIIAGCGRVGAQLAMALDDDGHDVAIIDKNRAAFGRLDEGFGGEALVGYAFDRETLETAGIKRTQAFVAVTSGDNSNIVSARAAKERYDVERVVARIYDPDRAVIYERLGITTIASARWTAESVLRELLPVGERVDAGIGPGHGDVVLVTLPVPPGTRNAPAAALNRPGVSVLTAITREGTTRVPVAGALLGPGDQVHVVVEREALEDVRRRVAALGDQQT